MLTIDRTFTALLTFGTLVCGTLAIGAAMIEGDRAMHTHASAARVIELPRVTVIGRRVASATAVAQVDASEAPTLR